MHHQLTFLAHAMNDEPPSVGHGEDVRGQPGV
jgi:hypothetical protein